LRHSLAPVSVTQYRYMIVTLRPVWQPNAGAHCLEKCNKEGGWCNFCGGKGVGACCSRMGSTAAKKDPSECGQFDVFGKATDAPVCVHTHCSQSNSKYASDKWMKSSRHKSFVAVEFNFTDAEECQTFCQTAHIATEKVADASGEDTEPATVFNFKKDGKCQCLKGSIGPYGDLKREYRKNEYISGPVYCPNNPPHKDDEDEEQDNELAKVPMQEVRVNENKSKPVKNVQQLETEDGEYVKDSVAKAASYAVKEFNPFYQHLAKFVERLSWVSGCGDAKYDAGPAEGVEGFEEDDWDAIVDFPFGYFNQCDWRREEKRTDEEWAPDDEHKRGWLSASKINMGEQAKMRTPYPAPGWLVRLMKKYRCLALTAQDGQQSGKSATIASVFPAAGKHGV